MLLALGTALLVVTAEESGMSKSDLSRVLQGMVTGIGFLGGGAILKLTAEHEIHGLTTAAGIWMTAAASAAAGLGQLALAVVGVCLGLLVLAAFVNAVTLVVLSGWIALEAVERFSHPVTVQPRLMMVV